MTEIRDGWHSIAGRDLYVRDGMVIRAMKLDTNGSLVPAGIYERDGNVWTNVGGLYSVDIVRRGIRKGRFMIA